METTNAVLGQITYRGKLVNVYQNDNVSVYFDGKKYICEFESQELSKIVKITFAAYTDAKNLPSIKTNTMNGFVVYIKFGIETPEVEEVMPAVEVAKVETTQAPAVVVKTYNEISAAVERYIVDLAKGKKGLEFVTESYIAKIGIEVARVLGKGGGHLIEIIGNYQEYLPKQINDIIDFHNCLYACRTELSGVTPPTPTTLTDFEKEVFAQISSNGNDFESSDDCLADGVKAIMQQPTKLVYKETIALRLLHFFNAHAKQYNCIAIDNIKSEKEFIDAYCKVENVCIALGIIQNFVSSQMYLAMQSFAEQEFNKEIYLSENKTVFEQNDLVIDKYGFLFGYGDTIIDKIKKSPYNYKPKDLRLSCEYEQICLDIESAIELLIDYNDNSFGCESFKNRQFDKTYHDFWIYKLQSLSGEEKEYIIRQIAELDKEFAKFLCEKVLPKIPDYKELYDFLELTI